MRRAIIDMTANAEAQFWILVKYLAWGRARSAVLQMGRDKGLVGQRPRHVPARLLFAHGTGIALECFTNVVISG